MTYAVRRASTTPVARELPTGLFVVTDPDGNQATVRLTPDRPGRWRCSGCRLRTDRTDCLHIFSAALWLAEHELGLRPYAPVPTSNNPTTDHIEGAHA